MYNQTITGGVAIFGNRSAFAEKVRVGRPNLGNRDRLDSSAGCALEIAIPALGLTGDVIPPFTFARAHSLQWQEITRYSAISIPLVSHNMTAMRKLCATAIWINAGQNVDDGVCSE